MNTNLPAKIPTTLDGTPITESLGRLHESAQKIAPEGQVKVIYVNNPFNPHQHDIEFLDLSKANKLSDVTEGLRTETTVASVNGRVYEAEEWEEIGLHSQDSVVIVQTPGGDSSKDILRLIAIIVVAVVAGPIAGAIAPGLEAGSVGLTLLEVGITVAGAMLVMAILPPALPAIANGDLESSPSYGIDGAKNTSEEGIPMPIVYGTFRMAGNIINLHTRNIGDDQYVYLLLNAGEGPIASISDIEINEEPHDNFQDVETAVRLGTSNQDLMEWFDDTITPTAVGATVASTFQTRSTGTIDQFRLDFVAPGGLVEFKDDGTRLAKQVNFAVEYKKTADVTWQSLNSLGRVTDYTGTFYYYGYDTYDAAGNVTGSVAATTRTTLRAGEFIVGRGLIKDANGEIVGYVADTSFPIRNQPLSVSAKQTSAVRFSFTSPLLEQGTYDIRVRRTSEPSTDPKIIDSIVWTDLNEVIKDDVRYNNTALLGIKIRLTDQISSLPNVTFLHGGKIITQRSSSGNWSQVPSNSPAWIAYDMLTNTRYGGAIATSRIDREKFIEWSDYCEETGLTFDGIFDQRTSLWDALNHVFRAGHARPIMLGTKYSVAIDKPTAPSQMFTSGNIIKDSFSQNWLPMTDRANEVDVSYFDANDRSKRRTVKVYDDAVAAGQPQNTASVTLFGITDATRATEEAIFLLKNNRLLRSTVSFRAPIEAIAVTVGDVFILQHEQPNLSQGGRLAAGSTTTTLQLDRPFTFDGAKSYKAIVRHDSQDRYTGTISSASGTFLAINRIFVDAPGTFTGQTDINRIRNGSGAEATILRQDPGNPKVLYVDDATGFSELESVTLFQTDAIEERNVAAATSGTLTAVPLSGSMQQAPDEFALWMIGEVALVDSEWRVTKMNIESDQTVTITGAEYNPLVYDWTPTTGAVVNPNSDFSNTVPQVTNLDAAITTILIGNVLRPAVDISWNLPADFEHYKGAEIQIATDGGAFVTVGQVTDGGTYFQYEVGVAQNIVIRVVAMSADGRYSLRSTAPTVALAVNSDTFAPQDPTAFGVAASTVGLTLNWTNPLDGDFGGCEIKRNTLNDEPGATLLYVTEPRQIQHLDITADNPANSYFYWIRAFDTDGNFSNWVASTPTSASPSSITSGTDATVGFLTNEAHTITADADGGNPVFTGASGLFKTFKGINETSATTTWSVLGADNTTVTINTAPDTPVLGQPAGYYEVTAETVPQDIHSIVLRGVTSDAVTVDKTFTITKSKAGTDGTSAKTVRLTASAQSFSYNNSTGTPALIGPASVAFTVNEQNTTGATTWQAFDSTGAEILPVTNVLSSVTDAGATMLETAFASITNNGFIRVVATREGISDEISVFELLSGQDGADGATAKTVQIEAPSQTFAYNNSTGTPILIGPTQIDFVLNRQNIAGGTSWTLVDALGADQTVKLTGATDTGVTLTEANFASIANNTFVKLTATAEGISDSVTIVELLSGQDGSAGSPGSPGEPAHSGFLTNEAHVLQAAEDGTGYSLVGAGGTFTVFEGITDVTTSAIFNITGGTDNGTNWTQTKNGLTLTLQEATGVYTLTGAAWTTDTETFTMTATHNGVTITKVYTISKSRAGTTGPIGNDAKALAVAATGNTFSYDNSTGTPALIGPGQIDFTANRQNITGSTTWALEDALGADQTAKLTGTGDTLRTLTAANFATITNNAFVKLTATADGISDTVTVYELISGQDGTDGATGATGATGAPGADAIVGLLDNETHTVPAAADGTGYSLTNAGGTFKVFEGVTDVTTSATFSIVGGTDNGSSWSLTQAGLTMTIQETTGVYSLSGGSWTTDAEAFILRAVYGGVTIDKQYVVTKARSGATGNTGPQGAPGRDGVIVAAVRENNNTFSGTLNGSMYVHGFDSNGNPADVNGAAFYDGTLLTVPKQHVDTSQHLGTGITGFLVLNKSGATFNVNATLVAIAATRIGNPSAGTIQWQYDTGTGWTDFTPTQNHVLIGYYTTSSANVIENASIVSIQPMSTAVIHAGRITAASLSAIAATIGTIETRPDNGGVGNTTPRLVLNNSPQPVQLYDEDDVTLLFGVTDTGTEARLYLKGDFVAGSINSGQMFSTAGIEDLRGRLGLAAPGPSATGGTVTTTLPVSLTSSIGTFQTISMVDGTPISSGGDTITLNFTIQDHKFEQATSITAGTWTVRWRVSVNGGTYSTVAGSTFTLTGDVTTYTEDLVPPQNFWAYNLNETREVTYTPTGGSTYAFQLQARWDSGNRFNARITAASGSEPVGGGAVAAHTHVASDITNFDTEVANNSAVAANTAKVSNATHSGDASGSTSLTLQPSAITGKTALTTGLLGTDELLVSDGGVLKRMDVSVMNAYFNSNLSFAASSHNHSASNITSGTLAVARGGTGVTSSTGSGSNVLSSSPSIASPTLTGSSLIGTTNFQDSEVNRPWLRDFSIRHQSVSATTTSTSINYSNGQSCALTLSSTNTTVTVTNWPVSGRNGQMQIEVIQGTTPRTITWTNVTWLIGTAPDLSTASTTYIIHLSSRDGGTTVYGSYAADSAPASGVTSFNSRTGPVSPEPSDYSAHYLGLTATAANSTLLGGIALRDGNNTVPGANQVLRTQGNGYAYFGWINTASGNTVTQPVRIYGSQDSFLRYYTPANLVGFLDNEAWNFSNASQPKRNGLGMLHYITSTYTSGRITVSGTAPASPAKGDMWFDTT